MFENSLRYGWKSSTLNSIEEVPAIRQQRRSETFTAKYCESLYNNYSQANQSRHFKQCCPYEVLIQLCCDFNLIFVQVNSSLARFVFISKLSIVLLISFWPGLCVIFYFDFLLVESNLFFTIYIYVYIFFTIFYCLSSPVAYQFFPNLFVLRISGAFNGRGGGQGAMPLRQIEGGREKEANTSPFDNFF